MILPEILAKNVRDTGPFFDMDCWSLIIAEKMQSSEAVITYQVQAKRTMHAFDYDSDNFRRSKLKTSNQRDGTNKSGLADDSK